MAGGVKTPKVVLSLNRWGKLKTRPVLIANLTKKRNPIMAKEIHRKSFHGFCLTPFNPISVVRIMEIKLTKSNMISLDKVTVISR